MLTIDELKRWFECTDEQAERLNEIQESGKRHAEQEWYPEGDFSSDADWVYGVGAKIQKLEEELNIYDSSVFDLYVNTHGEFWPGSIM